MNQKPIKHLQVQAEDGKFAGWPANDGLWCWGDEMLVGFSWAQHAEAKGHTYDPSTSRLKFARSLDGGEQWSIEDGLSSGITAPSKNHSVGAEGPRPGPCPGGCDFTDPNFALTFRRADDESGESHFYTSMDRGHSWKGPYALPSFGNPGTLARTDYLVEGPRSMLALMAFSKPDGKEGRVGCIRTADGAKSWQWVSWVSELDEGFAIMPATVRLSEQSLLTVVRRRLAGQDFLAAYRSDDAGQQWRELPVPVENTGKGGCPPALVRMRDGTLALAYGVRSRDPAISSRMYLRFSRDEGESWSREMVIRGEDGANWDMGYPRMAQRQDGALVVLYYYNHAWRETPSYRYLAASMVAPGFEKDCS